MGPTQNDFVNQFEQQISGSGSSKGGDIILTPDKPAGKRKKPIIIAAVAVATLLIVAIIAALFMGRDKTSGQKSALKDYALSMAYGINYGDHTETDLKNLPPEDYYLRDHVEANIGYLQTLEAMLKAVDGNNLDKAELQKQIESLSLYKTIRSYLINFDTGIQYSVPDNTDSELAKEYNRLNNYVESKQTFNLVTSSYENGDATEEEYVSARSAMLRAEMVIEEICDNIEDELVEYVKEKYE